LTTLWHIPQTTPVIAPGQLHGALDAKRASAAHVVRFGDMYRMAYWGTDATNKHSILGAEAPVDRPNDWRALGPMIGAQPQAPYNLNGPSFPFLLPVDDRYWLLYFCAWGQPTRRLPNTTGVAISEDAGKTWRYWRDEPMLALDRPYDTEGTGSLWVTHERGVFRMWYTAIGRFFDRPPGVQSGHGEVIPEIGIAYAESSDGLHWHKPLMDWVIKPRHWGVMPYEYIVSKPSMLIDGAVLEPSPSGRGQGEGVTHEDHSSPTIRQEQRRPHPNPLPEGEGVRKPRYTMWVNTFGSAYRVHRLTSDDGIAWRWCERVGPQGELGHGTPGAFDDHQRSYPVMLAHGEEVRCWYTGNGFGTAGMGYAVAP